MLNQFQTEQTTEVDVQSYPIVNQVGFFKEYDKKTNAEQEEIFSKATKKLVLDATNPGNYGYMLHEMFIKDWKEKTSWEVPEHQGKVSNQIGDFVNAKSIGFSGE